MQLMRYLDGIGFGWGSELRIAAQILLCLIVLGGVVLSPGKAGPYGVVLAPWSGTTSVYELIARADGRILATGAMPGIAIAESESPDFAERLYQLGAFVVFNPGLTRQCLSRASD